MDVAGRIGRLGEAIQAAGCDALVVTSLTNVRYLTGFTGSAALLLVAPNRCVFATDGRYATQSAEQLAAAGVDAEIVVGKPVAQREALAGGASSARRIGLEAKQVSWAAQQEFATEWFAGAELVATTELVETLRAVKDPGELARIEAAASIADRALTNVRALLADGPSEAEFGLALDFEMRRLGAADISFETIVASGPNAAMPHARPSSRPIGDGELVVLDFGAVVDGYHSDITRTLCLGEPAHPLARRMVDAVSASQAAGVAAVGPGVQAASIDAACREVLATYGWEDAFVHGTGHGVGLEIHEAPGVSAASVATLVSGNVVTVEPGVYLPGIGGVRIEDTLVVTADGCRPLTHAPKDLSVT